MGKYPDKAIGVIGCGNMGSALISGMLQKHFRQPNEFVVCDTDAQRLDAVKEWKVQQAQSNADLAAGTRVILLAVKPQQMDDVLNEIRPHLKHRPLIISIAAGIPIRRIEEKAGPSVPVVRVMPNTAVLVGSGISAISGGEHALNLHVGEAEAIFSCVGEVVRVSEELLDVVTAISGSGPAYFFFLMEQMIETGVSLGLSSETARKLVFKTAEGAAKLVLIRDPRELRAQVTSKGGTTEAAFAVFLEKRLGEVIQEGIRAAAARAKELGR